MALPKTLDLIRKYIAANKGLTPPAEGLPKNVKFVLCDVCDRLITFVVFRTTTSNCDVCSICKTAVEQSKNRRVVSARGDTMHFDADTDPFYCLGRAPVTEGALRAANMTATMDPDELRPATKGAQSRRLTTQMTVRSTARGGQKPAAPRSAQNRGAKEGSDDNEPKKAAPPRTAPKKGGTAELTSNSKRARSPSPKTKGATEPTATDAPTKQSRRIEAPPPPPPQSPPSPPVPPAAPPGARKGKAVPSKKGGGRSAAKAQPPKPVKNNKANATSDAEVPQPRGPIPSRRRAATTVSEAEVEEEEGAPPAATTTAPLFDKDDMPFFLSQATLSAASSQPVTLATSQRPVPLKQTAQAPAAVSSSAPQAQSSAASAEKGAPESQASPTAAIPRPSLADVDKAKYMSMVSSGPVAALFGKIVSLMSHKERRPLLEQPSRLVVRDEGLNTMTVEEGEARPWQNGYMGMSRRVTTAVICPTAEADGLWFSFACEGKEAASIEMWNACATVYGTVEVPVKRYTVSLGGGGVLGLSWVPVVLAKPDNDVLGVCTVLRQQLLLTCQLPRRNYPSDNIHVQIAGAQQIRVEGVSTMPVDVRWYTTHQSVAETFLLVTFECASVAVYQPLAETLNAKLSLVLLRTVVPPTRRASSTLDSMQNRSAAAYHLRIAPMALGVAVNNNSNSTTSSSHSSGGVYLAVGERDALCMMQAPSFELSSFSKLPMIDDEGGARADRVCAIVASNKGFVVASEHALHQYSLTKSEHKEISTDACSSAPIVALREVAPSLLVCANAAGQVVQARVRSSCLEVRPVLWIQRQQAGGAAAPTSSSSGGGAPLSTFVPSEMHLRRTFDGCQRLPREQLSTVRYAFHPVVASVFSSYALAYYPDGAWVLFPSSWEKK